MGCACIFGSWEQPMTARLALFWYNTLPSSVQMVTRLGTASRADNMRCSLGQSVTSDCGDFIPGTAASVWLVQGPWLEAAVEGEAGGRLVLEG